MSKTTGSRVAHNPEMNCSRVRFMFCPKLRDLGAYIMSKTMGSRVAHIPEMDFILCERRGGRIGEKSVLLILQKNRSVQHTFEI
jgi:hypothetical protein